MARPKLAVIYYSSTGNTHAMAETVAESAIASNPGWKAHHEATKGAARVSHAEIDWAPLHPDPLRPDGLPAQGVVTGQRVATVASWILKGRS